MADKQTTILKARALSSAMGQVAHAPAEIMFMPGGTHAIQATNRAGESVEVTVKVDRGTAQALQAALLDLQASSRQKPYIDFDHQEGQAAAWVQSFEWRDQPEPGVYAAVDWSSAGADAVSGKNYRAFSPSFRVDDSDPANVTGAPLCMGGLVNDPAFRAMRPLWARHHEQSEPTSDPMTDKELADLKAKISALEKENGELKAKATSSDNDKAIQAKQAEIDAKQAEIDALQSRVDKAEQELKAKAEAQADAEIQAAVDRGALPAQNQEVQAKWRGIVLADPANVELLRNLPGNQAVGAQIVQAGSRVGIIKEDTRTVMAAYRDAKTGKDRAAIYARDLRKRLNDRDELVIDAANSLGTVYGDLVVQRSLDLLKYEFPLLRRISTDFSDAQASYGQGIKTRLRAVPSVTDYNTSTGYASSDATTTDVTVTINAHKAVQVEFNANELASTRRLLFDEQEEGMLYSLGKVLVDALYGLILAANFTETATTQALSGFARATVISIGTALNGRGVTGGQRTLLLNASYYGKLAEDSVIVSNLYNRDAGSAIMTGQLPPVHGFLPIEAPNLITTGNLTGFGLRADALAMATRLPADYTQALPGVPATGIVSTITDPDTGISVMLVQFVDHKLGKAYGRVALMYGVAVGQQKSGQRLISA